MGKKTLGFEVLSASLGLSVSADVVYQDDFQKIGCYNGLWGGSGIMERGPWCYAKRAYVAYAVATKMMDGVTFSKFIDTGSSTVYAVEFKRIDPCAVKVPARILDSLV